MAVDGGKDHGNRKAALWHEEIDDSKSHYDCRRHYYKKYHGSTKCHYNKKYHGGERRQKNKHRHSNLITKRNPIA